MLSIKDLWVEIEKKKILQGLNLTINKGEVHAIMGPNGTGKSTLAKSLSAHYECDVTAGEVDFLGKDLLAMSADERAKEGLFMSFQNPVEIPGVNNLYFLRTAVNEKRRYEGLEELNGAQFLKYIKEKTKGLDIGDELLRRYVNDGFSGGEKKRNELLQMLLLEPRFLILDEIDSGLDIDALKTVANGVNALRSNERSILIITHYQRLLDLIKPDFVHILYQGKVVKTGGFELVKQLEEEGYDGVGHEVT